MARATAPVDGEKADPAQWPTDITADYVSKTDANAQTIASDVTVSGDLTVSGSFSHGAKGTASGTSPITIAHGLGSTPSVVLLTANAAQPYALGYAADGTNITVYHNAAASLTVSWYAIA